MNYRQKHMSAQFCIFIVTITGAIASRYLLTTIMLLVLAGTAGLILMYEIQKGEHLCHRPADDSPEEKWECPSCHLNWVRSGGMWKVRQ